MAFRHEGNSQDLLILGVSVFLVFSALLFASIVVWPAANVARRILGMIADSATTTFCVALSGEVGIAIFGVYLFISFGNGFRYGRSYLFGCQAMCLVGFIGVLILSDYWEQHQIAGWGLFIALIVLPLYVSTLLKRIHEARARAEEANRAKTTFLANMSHEMRTPLNGVVGVVDLFQMTELSTQQGELVRLLRHSVSVLRSLIDDVLDISKIEAGRLTLEVAPFDLHAMINGLLDLLRPHTKAKGLSLTALIDPQLEYQLKGDSHHLRQVLLNLLGNAIKFTETGGVTVSVARLNDSSEGVNVRFEVRDTGIGISPDALSRIFERFTQADESVTRRYGGTGLGTTIAKQLVELMGGSIGVQSKLGEGSLFWFELPLLKQIPTTAISLGGEGRIVVVADQMDASRIARLLGNLGWQLEVVPSRTSVERMVQAREEIRAIVTFGSVTRASELFVSVRNQVGDLPIALVHINDTQLTAVDSARINSISGANAFNVDVPQRVLVNAIHAATAKSASSEGAEIVDLALVLKQQRRKLKILVAEDNQTNQAILTQLLEKAGHTVVLASDGEEALDCYESAKPDLAILDFNMPQRTGVEVIAAIRAMEPSGIRMPAVILSASVTVEARERARRAGADDFIGKPIEGAVLLQALDRLSRRIGRGHVRMTTADTSTQLDSKVEVPLVDQIAIEKVSRITGEQATLKRLLEGFRSDVESRLDRIDVALSAEDLNTIPDLTHPIRGAALSVGAAQLVARCREMDNALPAGNVTQLRALAFAMRKCLNQTMTQLNEYEPSARRMSS
jgi:two-component system sensor histidine kinase RpfC